MMIMFHMMNAARLDVGAQGFLHASAAYLYALNYARERRQGRDLSAGKDASAPQVPIIVHPDIRRELTSMKAYVEGMRSFELYVAMCFDLAAHSKDPAEKEKYQGLIDLLTPVIKSYCTDRGYEICIRAIQVYGGYGYTREYPVEQLARDCKITSIYEGTNGIQAMDLLGRKLGMNKGAVFMTLLGEIQKTVTTASGMEPLAPLAAKVGDAVNRLGETAMHMGKTAMSENFRTAFAHACPFLDVVGDVVVAWMLLWRASAALPALEKKLGKADADARRKKIASNKTAAFYDGQVKSAAFFINTVLPVTMGRMEAIMDGDDSAIEMADASFGGI
jgi:hypothetical protein